MPKNLKERLAQQRDDLKKKGPGKFLTVKEGTTRIRVLPAGKEKDWALEVVYFYLGLKDNMAIVSPATFGKKCAVMEAYTKLSESKDANDRERALKFRPGKRFFIPVLKYVDEKGGEIDAMGAKLMLISGGVYQDLIELYLDDDNGDFTDPNNGYDIKIKRTGKGKMDTEYTVITGKKDTRIPKEFRKVDFDVIEMAKEITPKYEETKVIIEQYLNLPPEEGDNDDKPKKRDRGDRDKKKRRRDI